MEDIKIQYEYNTEIFDRETNIATEGLLKSVIVLFLIVCSLFLYKGVVNTILFILSALFVIIFLNFKKIRRIVFDKNHTIQYFRLEMTINSKFMIVKNLETNKKLSFEIKDVKKVLKNDNDYLLIFKKGSILIPLKQLSMEEKEFLKQIIPEHKMNVVKKSRNSQYVILCLVIVMLIVKIYLLLI